MAYQGVYGRGLTASSVASSLKDLDNYIGSQSYWQYGENLLASQYTNTEFSLQRQYEDAINKAYASSQKQRQILEESNLVGQARSEYQKAIESAYNSAYESYRQSLAEGRQSNIENYSTAINNFNSSLVERAENFAEFGNEHYEYLKYLYDTYYANMSEAQGPWKNDIFRNEFIVTNTNPVDGKAIFDEEGNPVTDDQGNQLYEHLRSMQSLYNTSMDEEGMYTSVYDENGALTPYGRAYFDMIENMEYGEDVTTFGDWLYGSNQELWEYMYESPNIFDTTSSQYGNIGTFKELTGREASDYTYSIAEHFNAMSKGQIKSYFDSAYSKIDEVFSGSMKDRAQTAIDSSSQIVDELEKLSKDLGIQQDFGSGTWNELRNLIKNADSYVKSGGEMTGEFFGWLATGAVVGSGSAIASLATGPAAPIVGPILALIGVGAGIASGSVAVDQARTQNEQYANQIKDQLRNAVDIMVGYSLGKREGIEDLEQYSKDFANQMAQQRIDEAKNQQEIEEAEEKEREKRSRDKWLNQLL